MLKACNDNQLLHHKSKSVFFIKSKILAGIFSREFKGLEILSNRGTALFTHFSKELFGALKAFISIQRPIALVIVSLSLYKSPKAY